MTVRGDPRAGDSQFRLGRPARKGDREIVLAAVAQNGFALYFAAAELKGDREFVLAAVANHCAHGASIRPVALESVPRFYRFYRLNTN